MDERAATDRETGGARASEQVAYAAELLHRLWGDDLPTGPAPWDAVSADARRLHRENAEAQGLVTAADELQVSLLAELLAYVPTTAAVRGGLPPAVRVRVDAAARDRGPTARALGRVLAEAAARARARVAMAYGLDGAVLVLQADVGLTAAERALFARVGTLEDGVLCHAVRSGLPESGIHRYPADGRDAVVSALAIPFRGLRDRDPVSGGLAVLWDGEDALPDLGPTIALARPYARQCELLLAAAGRLDPPHPAALDPASPRP